MNKIMEKEWFNGFVANGLQFRLDGYMINDFGVTYHIGVKKYLWAPCRDRGSCIFSI